MISPCYMPQTAYSFGTTFFPVLPLHVSSDPKDTSLFLLHLQPKETILHTPTSPKINEPVTSLLQSAKRPAPDSTTLLTTANDSASELKQVKKTRLSERLTRMHHPKKNELRFSNRHQLSSSTRLNSACYPFCNNLLCLRFATYLVIIRARANCFELCFCYVFASYLLLSCITRTNACNNQTKMSHCDRHT